MTNEVVVQDDSIRGVVPFEPMATTTRSAPPWPNDAPTGRPGRRSLIGCVGRTCASGSGPRLPMPITHVVPIVHHETDDVVRRRRRVVAGVSVLGAGLLGASLSTRPGSKEFYGATLTVAGVWTAGGLLSGPLHLGWIQAQDERLHRPVLTPVATGVGAFGFFYGCALVARGIPPLDRAISRVLVFAEEGDEPLVLLTTLANGLGEEVFFRGALYAALGATTRCSPRPRSTRWPPRPPATRRSCWPPR